MDKKQTKSTAAAIETDARETALAVLVETEKNKITLDRALARFSHRLDRLSKRDRALANSIIYGTLRWRGHLDWIIIAFSSRRLDQMALEVRCLVRMALYQIVHMDRIPVSAAVNSAVSMARKTAGKPAAGFVNALLRKAGHNHAAVALPDRKKDPALFMAAAKSLPLWLSKLWIRQFGVEKSLKLCDAINQIPVITVRANTLKIQRQDLVPLLEKIAADLSLTRYAATGVSFSRPALPIAEMEPFQQGLFQVQDEAAQLVTTLLDPQPGERILDACAGLGGKTGHAAQCMENRGEITAWDKDREKLLILESEMKRLGISVVKTGERDLLEPPGPWHQNSFDRVLLDAPCTGLGVLRRNPEARWNRCREDIPRLAAIQSRMLFHAADLVKPGGRLVYAVCSCQTRENEAVIQTFLDQRKEFSITGTPLLSPGTPPGKSHDRPATENSTPPVPADLISDRGFLKTYPDTPSMDGFFAVAMDKKTV
ncbi:MAG: 16S rRNA (cytosine(967)-C(5))-methyltransferase RsmB [Desulfobacteraceae bacterium]